MNINLIESVWLFLTLVLTIGFMVYVRMTSLKLKQLKIEMGKLSEKFDKASETLPQRSNKLTDSQFIYCSTYDENGKVIKTTFQEKLKEGHSIRVHTYGLDVDKPSKYFIEHMRSDENYNGTESWTSRSEDVKFNEERLTQIKVFERIHGMKV